MKYIITAGGTGGHIYPALAIINKIKSEEKDAEFLYIGTHNRMEKDIIPEHNIKYKALEIYGLSKTKWFRNIKNIFLVKKSIQKSIKVMKEFKPDVVIGCGGYVTYPVLKAAIKLKIKTFIHEQNSIPGKANIWLSKDVDTIGVSFKNSKDYFKKAKHVVYTGNPCGDNALSIPEITKESLGFNKNKKLIIIVAGSLGSETFNAKFKSYLMLAGKEDYEFLYITGEKHYVDFVKNTIFPKNVKVVPYLENLAGLIRNCDLIITRAGASTLSEIIALKKPSIIIPSPYVANNHQYYNALDLVNLGVAELIEEKNLSTELIQISINEILGDKKKYNNYINNLKKLTLKKSSDIIYDEIRKLIK